MKSDTVKFREIMITNPKCLNYKTSNYDKIIKNMGEIPGNTGEWGFHFVKRTMGFWTDINQFVLSIIVPKNCEYKDRIKEELIAIMKIIKRCKDGYQRVNIIEYTQAEDANYNVAYYPDTDQWVIHIHVQGNMQVQNYILDELVELLTTKYCYVPYEEEEDK